MRNNQTTTGYGFRQGSLRCSVISSSSILDVDMMIIMKRVVSETTLHWRTCTSWSELGFWVAITWHLVELAYTAMSIDFNNTANSSSIRLEQSPLWVMMSSSLLFLLDAFKIDLIYYVDIFSFVICELSIIYIVNIVIASRINLIL